MSDRERGKLERERAHSRQCLSINSTARARERERERGEKEIQGGRNRSKEERKQQIEEGEEGREGEKSEWMEGGRYQVSDAFITCKPFSRRLTPTAFTGKFWPVQHQMRSIGEEQPLCAPAWQHGRCVMRLVHRTARAIGLTCLLPTLQW